MAGPGITARAEIEIGISDTYLDAHVDDQSAVIDIQKLTPIEAFSNHSAARTAASKSGQAGRFEPRGIKISAAIGDDGEIDEDLNRAWINKRLKGCPSHNYVREGYIIGATHADSVGYIKPYNTTARGIVIKG